MGGHALLQGIFPTQGLETGLLHYRQILSGLSYWKTFLNEKESESFSVVSNSLCPMDCSLPGSSVLGIFQNRILEWVAVPFSRGSSQSRYQTQVSCIEMDSSPAEPSGKPKNTGVGSLSILRVIFQTQELNRGLLQNRWILYQLNHQGSHFK